MQSSFIKILETVLFNPASQLEFVISVVLAVIIFVAVLTLMGSPFNLIMVNSGRSFSVMALMVLVLGSVLAFVHNVYSPAYWVLIVAAVVLTLVIIVPCMCFILKGHYFSCFSALLISCAAAVVVTLFVHTIFGAISGGGKTVGEGLKRNRVTEDVLGQ